MLTSVVDLCIKRGSGYDPIKRFIPPFICLFKATGLAVIISHHQVCAPVLTDRTKLFIEEQRGVFMLSDLVLAGIAHLNSIQHDVIKVISDARKIGGFLRVFRLPHQ